MAAKKKLNENEQSVQVPDKDGQIAWLEDALLTAERLAAEEKQRADETYNDALRLRAEFDNFRKRNAESVRKAREEGAAETAEKFLPVADVIEKALEIIREPDVRAGVEMILKKLMQTFGEQGVTEIPALGEPFDPGLHNAIEVVGTADSSQSDTVVGVFMRGYTAGDRVLRHSVVRVAKYEPPAR
ncbi:MAG: nucleotide exchange factor GrpE [Clostridiales bacterium]|jgi:molecular chaperone GrpE|nr:nucleotide exchange factor GrpE [Clostridiales bacterium]